MLHCLKPTISNTPSQTGLLKTKHFQGQCSQFRTNFQDCIKNCVGSNALFSMLYTFFVKMRCFAVKLQANLDIPPKTVSYRFEQP